MTIMAASLYLIRLEEDLTEWRGLPELLLFPLTGVELISFRLCGPPRRLVARLDEQDKEITILFVAQCRETLLYEN